MATPSQSPSQAPPPPSNARYLIIALLLFGGAGIAAYFMFGRGDPPPPPTPPTPQIVDSGVAPPPVLADDLDIPEVPVDSGVSADGGRRVVVRCVDETGRRVPCQGGGDDTDWNCAGDIPRDQVGRSVSARQVRACYERALKQNNNLSGTLTVRMKISANGRVTATRLGGSVRDNDVFACVRTVASSWSFPAPRGGACAVVEVPFALTPQAN